MRIDPDPGELRTHAALADSSATRPRRGVLALGIAILVIEGWDLGALGTSGPVILESHQWGATTASLGMFGMILSLGMPFGALLSGRASDRLGRRQPVLVGLAAAAVGMAVSGFAPSMAVFSLGLAITGVAIGALTTSTIAFVADYAPAGRRSLHVCTAQCGIALGGLIVPFVGRSVLDTVPFQSLFLVGILAVVLVPIAWAVLPGGATEGAAAGREPLRALYGARLRPLTLLFSLASVFVLVLVSGVAVWLPTLLVNRGFDMQSALAFTVAFNGGAIAGTLAAAVIADRGRSKAATLSCLAIACLALLALTAVGTSWLVLAMSALAGVGTFGTQNLLNGYIAGSFPSELRGTALGAIMGAGRIGAIVGPGYVSVVIGSFTGSSAGLYALIVPAVCGALVLSLVHTRSSAD
ncbi:MFS transporter [Nocardia asteroides]|uniref:MFS transporter n=1 Tax=Nocardia asteroides TaxID=1824 RepID=UPI00343B40F0